jgi:hypothetical protein
LPLVLVWVFPDDDKDLLFLDHMVDDSLHDLLSHFEFVLILDGIVVDLVFQVPVNHLLLDYSYKLSK